jgi:energy-converting hydrogenase Eha subunit C
MTGNPVTDFAVIGDVETLRVIWGVVLVASFAFLGGGVKYIDQAFDEGIFNKKAAYALAVACGVVMGSLTAIDSLSATITLSLIISLAVTKKIDNIAFLLGALLVVSIPAITTQSILKINLLGLAVLTISSIGDEALNFVSDRCSTGALAKFLHFRPVMKVAMLALVLYGMFPLVYFVAFIAFDISYPVVEYLSFRKARGWQHDFGGYYNEG